LIKLLIDCPKQQILEIDETGGYNGVYDVIWDERIDGALPQINLGGVVRVGGALTFEQSRKDQSDAAIAAEAEENARIDDLETAVKTDTIINQLKAMTNVEYSDWFDNNITTSAQAIQLLKRLTRVIIRRV